MSPRVRGSGRRRARFERTRRLFHRRRRPLATIERSGHYLGQLAAARDDGTGTLTPSPFPSSVPVILSSSLSAGDWPRRARRQASLAAPAAEAIVRRYGARGSLAAGHLERARRRGARRGPGSAARAASSAAVVADAADAASALRRRDASRSAERLGPRTNVQTTRASRPRGPRTRNERLIPRPPARVRRDALALVQLLAASELRRRPRAAAPDSPPSETRSRMKRKPKKNATPPLTTSARRTRTCADVGRGAEDGENQGRATDYPLLCAVVACVEERAEEASSVRRRPSKLFSRDLRRGGRSEGGRALPVACTPHAALDAAAISHAGWSVRDARRHGVLAAAVVAAEAARGWRCLPPPPRTAAASHALTPVARLLAEPASARAASSAPGGWRDVSSPGARARANARRAAPPSGNIWTRKARVVIPRTTTRRAAASRRWDGNTFS